MATNPNRIRSIADDQRKRVAEQRYLNHRADLAAGGHDPDYIGTTEVPQPRCPCCREPIPWPLINLYR